jgi:glycosyltransferase involved in cell wall biosynthesis
MAVIAWLSHFVPYPPTSGALERSYYLLRHAAKRYDVHLLALDQRKLRRGSVTMAECLNVLQDLCSSVQIFSIPSDRSAAATIAARVRSTVVATPFDFVWLSSAAMNEAARGLAESVRPHLIHVDTIGLAPYGRHFPHSAMVLNHHNVESTLTSKQAERAALLARPLIRWEARKLRRKEQAVCPRAAMNLVVSEPDRVLLQQIAPAARVRLVENGIDTEYFAPSGQLRHESEFVFVGTLGWHANRDAARYLVTEIWPALNSDGRRRHLTLVGRDPQRRDWRSVATDTVSTTGFVPDTRPFLRDATAVLCPIRYGGGTKLKVLAALSMGKVLVASTAAVEGLNLTPDKHFLLAESVSDFVTQIRRLEVEISLQERLSHAARVHARARFDWSVIEAQLDAAYDAALEERGPDSDGARNRG